MVIAQRALRVRADGRFGPKTRAAVLTFQKRQHLRRTGIVTRAVWNRIEIRYYPLISLRMITLRQGHRGRVVAVTQRALRVQADGRFGPRTKAAVKRVQSRAGLARTGVAKGWTWVAIEKRMRR